MRRRLPPQQHPDRLVVEYYRGLRPILAQMRGILNATIADLKAEYEPLATVRTDDAAGVRRIVRRASEELSKVVIGQPVISLATRYGEAVSTYQRGQLAKQARAAVGIDLRKLQGLDRNVSVLLSQWSLENARLITSVSQRLARDISDRVETAVVTGQRWETLAKDLAARGDVTESRAKLIARDQVGKLFADVNKQRQENLGIEKYVWRTMRDNRVREEHEALDGEVFSWKTPPNEGNPGEPINCRCYAEPDLSNLLA